MTTDQPLDDDGDVESFRVPASRRQFLALMAGGAGAAVVTVGEHAAGAAGRDPRTTVINPPPIYYEPPTTKSFRLTRADDMIDLAVTTYNLVTSGGQNPTLIQQDSSGSYKSFIVFQFGPQHVAEEALYYLSDPNDPRFATGEVGPSAVSPNYSTGTWTPALLNPKTYQWHRALPLRSHFAGPSRVAFEIDFSGDPSIPYTTAGLLDWSNPAFVPALVAEAEQEGRRYLSYTVGLNQINVLLDLAAPSTDATNPETAIEFPYGMVLSPSPRSRWYGRTTPFAYVDNDVAPGTPRTEIWRARLRDVIQGGQGDPLILDPELRAVWGSDDPNAAQPPKLNPGQADVDPGYLILPTRNDKWQLIQQSLRRTAYEYRTDQPSKPITARKFELSSIGANVDMSGEWASTDSLDIVGYVHKAFAGRDNFVKVVAEGYLYPTMHLAAEVKVTERVFTAPVGAGAATGTVSYLQERAFLVVKQRTRTFDSPDFSNPADLLKIDRLRRAFPFKEVTINVDRTPDIFSIPLPGVSGPYFPGTASGLYKFPCTVVDQLDQDHHLEVPLLFVRTSYTNGKFGENGLQALKTAYDAAQLKFRTISVPGFRIGFAPDFSSPKFPNMDFLGKTALPTFSISLYGLSSFWSSFGGLSFGDGKGLGFPSLDFASISLDSLGSITGLGNLFGFRFPKVYLDWGFDGPNILGGVFAKLFSLNDILAAFNVLKLELPSLPSLPSFPDLGIKFPDLRALGGLVAPNFDLSGLSAVLGSFGGDWPSFDLGGLPSIFGGGDGLDFGDFSLPNFDFGSLEFKFDPSKWFGSLDSFPSILGGIHLPDILGDFHGPDFDPHLPSIPGLDAEIIWKDVAGKARVPIGAIVRFQWCSPHIKESVGNVFVPTPDSTKLCIKSTITIKYDVTEIPKLTNPSLSNLETTVEASAILNDFKVNLIGDGAAQFLILDFESIAFTVKNGADPKVTPNLRSVDFAGAMKLIDALKEYFGSDSGSSDPEGSDSDGLKFTPIYDLTSERVTLGFLLGLPTIAIGVFSLSNVELGLKATLPFNGDPFRAELNVCEPKKPFLLTVGIFGGGGYFVMSVGLDGVQSLEISFEFGCAAQVSLGVASGSVKIMAGVMFKITRGSGGASDKLELAGFFDLNGRLEILGIITVSAEFKLTLSYIEENGVGYTTGRAELTITVKVAFFSKDVSMSVEKKFGSGEAPTARPVSISAPRAFPAGPASVRYSDLISKPDYRSYAQAFA